MSLQQSAMKALAKPETIFKAKTVNGEEYEFRIIHWSPTKTFQRISTVGKYFAVPISMLGGMKPEDENFSVVAPTALLQLFNTMDENNFLQFLAEMLDEVLYKNMSVVEKFDDIFMGKNELVVQVIAKVLEVNYAPFLQTGFASLMTSIVPVVSLTKTN